ncbi:MAG: hypothetical protein II779_02500, partial [Clostridia bacterium]|nr:hypothetical protein [Clostridia bacterium]
MSRLVISESAEAREDEEEIFDTETRVPTPTPFPTKYNPKSRTAPHPDTHFLRGLFSGRPCHS